MPLPPQGAYTVSFVLQQQGNDWKLGGFYAKPAQIAGHDGNWFAARAREFKSKGQLRNAWFYFGEARELLVPVPFMATATTDRLYDEMQAVKPADLPPLDLTAGAKTFKVTDLFPVPVGRDFDLVVKYQSADISDTGKDFSGQPGGDESAAGEISGVSRCLWRNCRSRGGPLGKRLRVDAADERHKISFQKAVSGFRLLVSS